MRPHHLLRAIYGVLATLALAPGAQAATIDVQVPAYTILFEGYDGDVNNQYLPPLEFDGFFFIVRNQVVDFEFSAFGRTWTEADGILCDCRVMEVFLPQHDYFVELIAMHWTDGVNSWRIALPYTSGIPQLHFHL